MTKPAQHARLPFAKPELFGTVFVLGAATMVIEIMGTRVIGPVFGVGLFVWSALLSVTLGALAVGYYCGGELADKTGDPRLLGGLTLSTGVLLALVPLLSHAVLSATEGLGPRWGALGSAVLLFAPSLTVLGMTGPVAVRRATQDLRLAGRSVGSIYAVSTLGSVVGTLGLAYGVIPVLETQAILLGTSGLLVALGALPSTDGRHRKTLLGHERADPAGGLAALIATPRSRRSQKFRGIFGTTAWQGRSSCVGSRRSRYEVSANRKSGSR